ncbi:hypothetical protein GCM10025768_08060 [Microbacterium pseudoresistens]
MTGQEQHVVVGEADESERVVLVHGAPSRDTRGIRAGGGLSFSDSKRRPTRRIPRDRADISLAERASRATCASRPLAEADPTDYAHTVDIEADAPDTASVPLGQEAQ